MTMTTRSYQEYLIESLKNRSRAALYIWAILQAENPEPELLASALKNVSEALGETNLSGEEAKRHLEKLNELKNKQGSEAIYSLSDWLKELKLTLTVIDEQQYYIKNIFMDLAFIRDREKNTRKTSIWQGLAPGKWSKIFLIGIFVFLLLAFISNIIFPPINIANKIVIIVLFGLIWLFLLLWLSSSICLNIKNEKSPQEIREERLIKTGKEVEMELEEATILSTKYSKKQLDSAIRKLKSSLEEMEGKKKVKALFTPILVLISIGFYLYISGISPEDIEKYLPFLTSFGGFGFFGRLGGFLAFVFLILKFIEEDSWQSENTEYKRRLFILEEAKDMTEQREADLEIVINKLIQRSPQ